MGVLGTSHLKEESMPRRWKNRPEHSNWGDFGEDDELGRLNLITPECRRAAAREVKESPLGEPADVAGEPAMGRYLQ
jgi:hypothetical protein